MKMRHLFEFIEKEWRGGVLWFGDTVGNLFTFSSKAHNFFV